MYKIATVILIICIFALPAYSVELEDFSVSATIYPDKLPKSTNNGWLVNDQEWLKLSVDFTIETVKSLYIRFNPETYIFGIKGAILAPSSTKFTSEVSYKFNQFAIKFRHYCWHYYHQFEDLGHTQDKLIFEYSF